MNKRILHMIISIKMGFLALVTAALCDVILTQFGGWGAAGIWITVSAIIYFLLQHV